MQALFQGLLLSLTYFMSVSHGVNPACECVIYQSSGKAIGGVFKSPNFPHRYPSNINCILFTFIGDHTELIELTFLRFDVKLPTPDGRCRDFLKFFTNLDRAEINENNMWDYERCGSMDMIEKKHYSSGRSLILEFHSDGTQGNYTGFKGIFKFLDKSQFETNGVKEVGTPCRYVFQSTDKIKDGRFFSPRYPQNYPPSSKCQYIFQGFPEEKIKITFKNIQLHHNDTSCRDNPDAIVVYDGLNRSGTVIGSYCDTHNEVGLVSSGQYMYIDFYSDGKGEMQGFAAEYEFVKSHKSKIQMLPNDPMHVHDNASTCNKRIISSLSKNGTISSPHFPHPYPADITCRYTFEGVDSKERIQLKFVHMDLKYPGSNPQMAKECDGIDSVTITVVINGHNKNLGTYCGSKLPPMLMSNTAKMYVTFRSIRGTRSITGFEATYQFLTNFGISTGEQDSREVCMFNYHSAKKRSGNFTSPNYPGLYPRNTECHYLFFAKKDEYVQIKFTKFDVDGIRPGCGKKTESDYVAFSNFKEIEDRSIDRFCGNNIAPSEVESDGTFFRVIFKSNHLYDSSGFFAHYEFISTVKTDQYKTIINTDGKPETNIKKNVNPGKSTNRSSSQHRHSTFTIYFILMSILLKL